MSVAALVAQEARAVRRARLFAVGGQVAGVTLGLLAFAELALGGGRWLVAPRWLPLAVTLFTVGVAGALALRGTRRALRHASRRELAQSIEREQMLRSGALRAGLELEGRSAFAAAGLASLETRLSRVAQREGTLAPASRGRAARAATGTVGAAGAVAIVVLGLAPTHGDGLRAVALPLHAWTGDLLTRPALVNVPRSVARGRRFTVRASAPGRRELTLRERETGTAWRERTITLDASGKATASVGPVVANVHLQLTDGRVWGEEVVVRATDRAYIAALEIVATPPRYLGLSSERFPADQPVRVPRGTVLQLRGEGSIEPRAVWLSAGPNSVALRLTGNRFAGVLRADRDARWEWHALAADDADVERPPALDVQTIPDSAPRIEIALPESDTIVLGDPKVLIRLVASDDHGLSRIALRTTKSGSTAAERVLARNLPVRWGADVALDAATLQLTAGSTLAIVAEATDDSPWAQTARSRVVVLRVPGLAEQRELARRSADSLAAAAAAAVAAQRDLARRTGEAARSRGQRTAAGAARSEAPDGKQPTLGYDDAQRARALKAEQEKLSRSVDAMREQASSLERRLDRAGALDSALASRLAEAQRMLAEALTPDLARALAGLDTALRAQRGDGTRASLADMAKQQQKLREQLERVAEMLARAAVEGTMETLRDEATDLANAERALADSGVRAAAAGALAKRSTDLVREVNRLGERLQQAGGEAGAPETAKASGQAAASAQSMRRAAAAGGEEQAAQEARGAAAQMEQAAQSLAQAREAQVGAWKSELAQELDRSIQELLQLGGEQRSLEERSRAGTAPAALRGEQSALQQGVNRTSERLERAGRASSLLSGGSRRSVSEARQGTARATEETAQPAGRPGNSADAMRDAADALTRAAAALVRDRERVNSSASATGFAEMLREMQELAKKQGALNGESAGLFQMPGGKPGEAGEGREGARSLAREQRGVAQSLDELGDADGSGRTEALAAEARRVAEALERGDLSAATRERQERLFRRMLDAGRALQGEERDDAGKRESRSASGVDVVAPAAGDPRGAAATRYREPGWDELRGLSAEERRAVIDYFRRLNGGPRDR